MGIKGIKYVHDLHIWNPDGESHVLTLHIVTDESDNTGIKTNVNIIANKYNIVQTTMEYESNNIICKNAFR